MANNKNQHFVPKCYLKSFCADSEGKRISLYNINGDRFIRNAPTRGQCSDDYFYGHDLAVESALTTIEGVYSGNLRSLIAGEINQEILSNLKLFAYLQYHRTASAAKRRQLMISGLFSEIDPSGEQIPQTLVPTMEQCILESLQTVSETASYIEDLKVLIVKNVSCRDFVTSDDPAIIVNRFYSQRLRSNNFGLMSSGLMLVLPLTNRLGMIVYDKNIYVASRGPSGYAEIRGESDVNFFNELQFIKAYKNIYFKDPGQIDDVRSNLASASSNRRDSWFEITSFVQDGITEHGERYRPMQEEDRLIRQTTMVASGMKYPVPSNWISVIGYRHKPISFVGRGSVGHVRKPEWMTRSGRRAAR